MATPEPDIDGFIEAQAAFQDKFGRDVTFVTLGDVTFPPGTQIDPETDRPYDPTITGSAGASAAVVVQAIVVQQPLKKEDEVLAAIGEIEIGQSVLILDQADWQPQLADADYVEVFGEKFDIQREDEDGIANKPPHRHIVVIQQL